MKTRVTKEPLMLFDGVCNLCSATVQFVIKYDRQERFRFAALQSQLGMELTAQSGDDQLDSVLLYYNGDIYRKSSAAIHILKLLGGMCSLAYIFIIIPAPFRDFIYDIISKRRYLWFGKKDQCRRPDESLKKRFLDKE